MFDILFVDFLGNSSVNMLAILAELLK